MNKEKSEQIIDIIRSILYAIVITLLLILVFALIVKMAELTDDIIKPVNQVIKVISIFLGLLMGIKKREKGLIKGFACGLIFTVLSILLFSLLSKEVIFSSANLIEIIVGALLGSISGVIVLTIKK